MHKNNAIIFYDDEKPVRLVVINKDTDIENCISVALSQNFNNTTLKKLYEDKKIKSYIIDMKEQAISNEADKVKEIDVGSCDRWKLLYNMLKEMWQLHGSGLIFNFVKIYKNNYAEKTTHCHSPYFCRSYTGRPNY